MTTEKRFQNRQGHLLHRRSLVSDMNPWVEQRSAFTGPLPTKRFTCQTTHGAIDNGHDLDRRRPRANRQRRLAGVNGTVLVMDERVADTFDPTAGDVERFMNGFSVLHYLSVGLEDHP